MAYAEPFPEYPPSPLRGYTTAAPEHCIAMLWQHLAAATHHHLKQNDDQRNNACATHVHDVISRRMRMHHSWSRAGACDALLPWGAAWPHRLARPGAHGVAPPGANGEASPPRPSAARRQRGPSHAGAEFAHAELCMRASLPPKPAAPKCSHCTVGAPRVWNRAGVCVVAPAHPECLTATSRPLCPLWPGETSGETPIVAHDGDQLQLLRQAASVGAHAYRGRSSQPNSSEY